MRWRVRGMIIVAIGLAAGSVGPARGQDLGRLLERAAKDRLREALAPVVSPPRPGMPAGRPGVPTSPAPGLPATPPSPGGFPGAYPYPPSSAAPAPAPAPAPVAAQAPRGEVVPVRTADGWTLVAHHYRPTAPPVPGALPVILCHGLTYSAVFWDLDPSVSLAEYLASQGFDVWAVSLRGSGMSQKWVWGVDDAPEVLFGSILRRATKGKFGAKGYTSFDPKYANWSLDDHIAYDLPAFVWLVKRQTGAPQVAWVGHSMGGIIALAHLARHGNPGIGRLVTVGSQLTMPEGQVPAQFLRELIQTRERQLTGAIHGAELVAQSRTSVYNMFFNQHNVASGVYEALTSWATDIPSLGLMRQYMTMADRGMLFDASGRFNYAQAVGNVNVPVLLACGATDQFAPPRVQKFLYDRIGSTDKTLLVFGRASGYAADAGHDDALVGLNSRAQVFPALAKWLATPR